MSNKDLSGKNLPTGGGQNDVKPSYYMSRNKFPKLTYKMLTTARYGNIFPTFYFHGTRGDKIPLNSSHELDTFTLKSPLKSDVRFNKTYVKVPYKAIYHHDWDIMRVPPTTGDDVPNDVRAIFPIGSIVHSLHYRFTMASNSAVQATQSIPLSNIMTSWFTHLLALESILSEGSLFSQYNLHFSKYFFNYYFGSELKYIDYTNYDAWFDDILMTFVDGLKDLDLMFVLSLGDRLDVESQVTYNVVTDMRTTSYSNAISFRTALDLMRDEVFSVQISPDAVSFVNDFISASARILVTTNNKPALDFNLNIEPIIAYQLACYQFFTDSNIDYIYDADQYRRMILSFYRNLLGSANVPAFFDYNSFHYEYDVFSNYYFRLLSANIDANGLNYLSYPILLSIFSHRRSLRYKDYFTGCRPRPLAVGDIEDEYTASVNSGKVSAISVARSMQFTRFGHNVSLAGRRIADYLQMIVPGKRLDAPDDQPLWLAHESFILKGFEVENTGNAQLSNNPEDRNIITTNLKSSAGKFSFMTEVEDQCIILGLGSFDIARVYSRTIDRFAFHENRFDDFIPQLQFIGDQELYDKEIGLNIDSVVPLPYGYHVRHKEYKQKYHYACGGFIDNLPSWAFVTDNTDGVPASNNINSLYIRAVPSEFDRFYKSLTGYSLGSYFHFILCIKNDLSECSRAMIPAPEILK